MKRLLCLLLIVIIVLPGAAVPAAAQPEEPFISGVVPEPYTLTYPVYDDGLSGPMLFSSGAASYISPYVTGVKNQAQNGICWAFAATAGIEANIVKNPGLPNTADLSELHMTHSLSNSSGNAQGFNRLPSAGGHRGMAAAYLMRGGIVSGTVAGEDDPYTPYLTGAGIQPRPLAENDKPKNYTVENIMYLSGNNKDNSPGLRAALKDAIVAYGAVACSMYWDGSSAVGGQSGNTNSYNAGAGAFFYNGSATQNHAVTLVGWDDNYDRTNFIGTRRPAGNGAWLVKNSWGSNWGIQPSGAAEKGYFWISYEDTQAPVTAWVIDGVKEFDPNATIYEYDPQGVAGGTGYANRTFGANVFTVDGSKGVQSLDQVKFFVYDADTTASIYVIPDYTGSLNISGAQKIMTNNTFTYSGWYTFDGFGAIPLDGDQFAVIVEYAGSGNAVAPLYYSNGFVAAVTQDVSYISSNGTSWSKRTNDNVCVKAVTVPMTLADGAAVGRTKTWLTWDRIKGQNDTKENVRANLSLPDVSPFGADIAWSASPGGIISVSGPGMGTVTRPSGETVVVLTAAISKGSESEINTFTLDVMAALSDAGSVGEDTQWLDWNVIKGANDQPSNVTADLSLPAEGREGTTVTWASSNTAVLSGAGAVTRPAIGQKDAPVTLTATVSKGGASEPVTFDLIIKALLPPVGALTVPSSGAAQIDLATESINLNGMRVLAYSLNGGKKWKRGALPAADKFAKLFNKDLELWLSDLWIDTVTKEQKQAGLKKGVPEGYEGIVKFPVIQKRPKADKLTAYYPQNNINIWYLAKKNETESVTGGIEMANTTDGKKPDAGGWNSPDSFSFGIPNAKATVLVRKAPSASEGEYIPASKAVKAKLAPYGKKPNYKINAKKGVIVIKKGDAYSIDGEPFITVSAKTQLEIADLGEPDAQVSLRVMKAPTGKKPASLIQELKVKIPKESAEPA